MEPVEKEALILELNRYSIIELNSLNVMEQLKLVEQTYNFIHSSNIKVKECEGEAEKLTELGISIVKQLNRLFYTKVSFAYISLLKIDCVHDELTYR